MKSLSLSRPLVILVVGIPGSGKSFFARQFASTFNAPLVSTDLVRHTLVATPSYSNDENAAIWHLALAQLNELLKTERTVIVDGGVNTVEARQAVMELAHQKGYGTLMIWVQTDMPTAEFRSTKRSKRRKGDENNVSMEVDMFKRIVKQLEPPVKREDYVVVSGKHTFATQVRIVLKKIVAPREAGSFMPSLTKTRTPQQSKPNVLTEVHPVRTTRIS